MAGDDTMSDPLFKNVPRRPRSTASAPDDGGRNPGGSVVSNNASSPPAMSAASSNERRPSSTVGGAEHDVPQANNKKKHRLAPIGVLEKKAASPSASSGSSEADPDDEVDWAAAENERRRQCLRRKGKGKMPVVNEDSDVACRRRPPPASGGSPGLCNGNKLLGDAIRSHHFRSTAATMSNAGFEPPLSRTKQPKKPKTKESSKPTTAKNSSSSSSSSSNGWPFWFGPGTGRNGMSWAGSDVDHSFATIPIVSDRLRATLRSLGIGGAAAPAPVRVYGKLLTRCDRNVNEARLLMSIKSLRHRGGASANANAVGAGFPPCAILTEQEKDEVHDKDHRGLALTAYDRGGDAYEMRFRYLESNKGYRLISSWTEFLNRNGLVAVDGKDAVDDDVMVDLWMFRSPAPEGKVGMVVLHYRRGDAAHADAALDEVEQKRRQRMRMLNNGDVEEDGVGDGDANEEAGKVAAPSSSSPSEPDGGGASKAAEGQDGAPAPGEAADAPSTSSEPELHGGGCHCARRSGEVSAPLSLGLGGGGAEEEQEVVLGVEVAAQSTMQPADEVAAAAPSLPEEEAGGGDAAAATRRMTTGAQLAEAELQAAQGLMKLSEVRRPCGCAHDFLLHL